MEISQKFVKPSMKKSRSEFSLSTLNSLQNNGANSVHSLSSQFNKIIIPPPRFPNIKQEYEHKLYDPPSDRFTFEKSPKWKIGSEAKNLKVDVKYPYYSYKEYIELNVDKNWDRIPSVPKITGKKFQLYFNKETPGPIYDIKYDLVKQKSPAFSMAKKFNQSSFVKSENENIGPGLYRPELKTSSPKWKFSNEKRKQNLNQKFAINDTYLVYKSCDYQVDSTKRSSPKRSFGKSKRDDLEKIFLYEENI